MKPKDLPNLDDAALIKAHLQAAESEAAKSLLATTDPGRVLLGADPNRRAGLATDQGRSSVLCIATHREALASACNNESRNT